MKAILNRIMDNGKQTLGLISFENDKSFFILEPSWQNNERKISCIPIGNYIVKPHNSPTHGKCFKIYSPGLDDVIGRDEVLQHKGNLRKNTLGCQLPGMGVADINADGEYDVTSSGVALKEMMDIAPEGYELEIVSSF